MLTKKRIIIRGIIYIFIIFLFIIIDNISKNIDGLNSVQIISNPKELLPLTKSYKEIEFKIGEDEDLLTPYISIFNPSINNILSAEILIENKKGENRVYIIGDTLSDSFSQNYYLEKYTLKELERSKLVTNRILFVDEDGLRVLNRENDTMKISQNKKYKFYDKHIKYLTPKLNIIKKDNNSYLSYDLINNQGLNIKYFEMEYTISGNEEKNVIKIQDFSNGFAHGTDSKPIGSDIRIEDIVPIRYNIIIEENGVDKKISYYKEFDIAIYVDDFREDIFTFE